MNHSKISTFLKLQCWQKRSCWQGNSKQKCEILRKRPLLDGANIFITFAVDFILQQKYLIGIYDLNDLFSLRAYLFVWKEDEAYNACRMTVPENMKTLLETPRE